MRAFWSVQLRQAKFSHSLKLCFSQTKDSCSQRDSKHQPNYEILQNLMDIFQNFRSLRLIFYCLLVKSFLEVIYDISRIIPQNIKTFTCHFSSSFDACCLVSAFQKLLVKDIRILSTLVSCVFTTPKYEFVEELQNVRSMEHGSRTIVFDPPRQLRAFIQTYCSSGRLMPKIVEVPSTSLQNGLEHPAKSKTPKTSFFMTSTLRLAA